MAFSRQPFKVLLVLAAALFAQASTAVADDDVMPSANHSIPSAAAQEIAPPGGIPYVRAPAPRPRKPAVPVPSHPPVPATAPTAIPEPEDATARNAAGVAGMPASAGVVLAPADATQGASGPVSAHKAADAAKPGIPASNASPGGDAIAPGETKGGERLEPEATLDPAAVQGGVAETVRVPAPIAKVARRMLPGISFSAVDLSRSGPATVYTLSGTTDAGRAATVSIDQSGTVRTVERQARDQEIPAEVMTLAEAALPGARIERAMLSLRPAFVIVYVFTGSTGVGAPFTLEIRSDGRSLSFVDPE